MAISVNARGGFGVERDVGSALPIRYEEAPQNGGWLLAGFGLFFGAIPSFFIYKILETRTIPILTALFPLAFLAVAALILAAGLKTALASLSITIENGLLTYRQTAPWGSRQWSEPVSAYAGVLASDVLVSGGRNSADFHRQRIVLKHRQDAQRDVELLRTRDGPDPWARARAFGELLGVPVLHEALGGGLEAVDAASLEKSLAERAHEGRVSSADVPPDPPGRGLRCERRGEDWVLSCPAPRLVLLIVLALGLPFAVVGFKEGSVLFTVIGSALTTIVLSNLVWPMRHLLLIERAAIRGAVVLFGKELPQTAVAIADIKDVYFASEQQGSKSQCLRIEGEGGVRIDFGQSLSAEQKDWLRRFVTAAIAKRA